MTRPKEMQNKDSGLVHKLELSDHVEMDESISWGSHVMIYIVDRVDNILSFWPSRHFCHLT